MKSDLAESLHYLFCPSSVAVVGASSTFGKWGFNIFNRLTSSHPKAKVYPVNRSADIILGHKAYPNLLEIPGQVDVAVIVVPTDSVPAAVQECVDKGVKAAIIVTAGFRETGEEGSQLESEVLRIARKGGIRIVGPNCMGHFNTAVDLFTAGPVGIRRGPLALISQSGNFGEYILERGNEKGAAFSKYVSSGNEADLTVEDYLEFFAEDEETKVICAYIEGIKDGRRFFDLARHITKEKPFVVMKVGRTAEAARAVLSHTGSLAGSDAVHDAIFRQCGVIRVEEVDELLDIALALIRQPLPRGKKVGILTAGGGFGAVATDACRRYGLEVPALSEETVQILNKYLPPRWSHSNPVDMAGSFEGNFGCIGNLLKTDQFDAVLIIGSIGFPIERLDYSTTTVETNIQEYAKSMIEDELRLVDGLIERIDRYQKPLIINSTPGGSKPPALAKLEDNGIYTYRTPEDGARVISYLAKYSEYRGLIK